MKENDCILDGWHVSVLKWSFILCVYIINVFSCCCPVGLLLSYSLALFPVLTHNPFQAAYCIMECVQKLGLKSQLLFCWAGVTKTISKRNFHCHNTLKCRVWCELVSWGLSQKSAWKSDFYQCKQFVVCHMIQYTVIPFLQARAV